MFSSTSDEWATPQDLFDKGKASSVTLLLPARTDTAWYHDYCTKGFIVYLRGRLKFGGAKNAALFPSMIVIFMRFDEVKSNA